MITNSILRTIKLDNYDNEIRSNWSDSNVRMLTGDDRAISYDGKYAKVTYSVMVKGVDVVGIDGVELRTGDGLINGDYTLVSTEYVKLFDCYKLKVAKL